jgi:hypothetical protein
MTVTQHPISSLLLQEAMALQVTPPVQRVMRAATLEEMLRRPDVHYRWRGACPALSAGLWPVGPLRRT